MKQKCLYLMIIFFMLPSPEAGAGLSPQEKIIDSMKRLAKGHLHDTVRAANWDLIAYYYQTINPDSGIRYAALSYALAENANWKKGQILALMDWSNNFRAKSDFAKAIEKGEMALELLKTEKFPGIELAVLTNLSLTYKDLGYSGKALAYLFRALELEKQSPHKTNLPVILENIGSLYLDEADYKKADSLFDMSYSIQVQRGDSAGMARNLSNKARLKQKLGQTDKAIALFNQALEISVRQKNKNSMQVMYANLGIAYNSMRLYDSAISCLSYALELSRELNMERSIAINSGNLGQALYSKANDKTLKDKHKRKEWLKSAKSHLIQACELSFKSNFRGPYLEFSEYLTQLYLEEENYKAAADVLAKRLLVMKLVNDEEEKVKMVKLESQLIMEGKEHELKQNIKNLEISELRLAIEKRNVFALILIFVFIVVLGSVVVLYLKKRGDYHKSKLRYISLSHSHEIRGPLARIMGLADLLSNENLEEADREYIHKSIEKSARDLDRNITEIINKTTSDDS